MDLSIQRKVLLCAVLIVVFKLRNQAHAFVQEVGMCVWACVCVRHLAVIAIYVK